MPTKSPNNSTVNSRFATTDDNPDNARTNPSPPKGPNAVAFPPGGVRSYRTAGRTPSSTQPDPSPKHPSAAHSEPLALNAIKHGIRAKALVASLQCNPLFDDDPQAFVDLVQGLVDHFHPEGPIEESCVEDIAICQCPSAEGRRVVIAETGHIGSAQAILLSGPGADNSRLRARPSQGRSLPYFEDLEKLNRYEISIQRQLKRSLDTLTGLIRERRSNAGQSGSGSPSKQKLDRDADIAGIRREVLGYLMAEFGPNGSHPQSESAAIPEEGLNNSTIATAAANGNLLEQSQLTSSGPDAVAFPPRGVRSYRTARRTQPPISPNSREQTQPPVIRPDTDASAPPSILEQPNPREQSQSPDTAPGVSSDSLPSTGCIGAAASPLAGVRSSRSSQGPVSSNQSQSPASGPATCPGTSPSGDVSGPALQPRDVDLDLPILQ